MCTSESTAEKLTSTTSRAQTASDLLLYGLLQIQYTGSFGSTSISSISEESRFVEDESVSTLLSTSSSASKHTKETENLLLPTTCVMFSQACVNLFTRDPVTGTGIGQEHPPLPTPQEGPARND